MDQLTAHLQMRLLEKGGAVPYELLLLADPSRELIDSYIFDSTCYIAYLDQTAVGVYVLQEQAHIAEIKNIAVPEQYQGKGIGKYLLHHACRMAKEKGWSRIRIGTGNSSVGQLYLYQQQGFEMTAIVKDFFTRHYPDPIYENGIACKHMVLLEKIL
ncbi:GNAT family N-acetyltransferase [Chitinophaga defluvii]|uniref:GNAT family N-acetyltransferase n=1 Tax=Chitinophaga defluvii TaxID=3163343 RepID=A0ABV2SYQ2_9BACT